MIDPLPDIDLEPMKFSLIGRYRWSVAKVDKLALLYKCFLSLRVQYAEETLTPTPDVDSVWHAHILDTLQYRNDCQKAFGHFVDHMPFYAVPSLTRIGVENFKSKFLERYGLTLEDAGDSSTWDEGYSRDALGLSEIKNPHDFSQLRGKLNRPSRQDVLALAERK